MGASCSSCYSLSSSTRPVCRSGSFLSVPPITGSEGRAAQAKARGTPVLVEATSNQSISSAAIPAKRRPSSAMRCGARRMRLARTRSRVAGRRSSGAQRPARSPGSGGDGAGGNLDRRLRSRRLSQNSPRLLHVMRRRSCSTGDATVAERAARLCAVAERAGRRAAAKRRFM